MALALRMPKRVYPRMPKALPLMEQYPLYALYGDGVDDYVEVPDSASLQVTSAASIELWLNIPVGATGGHGVLNKYTTISDYDYMLYLGKSGGVAFYIKNPAGTGYAATYVTAVMDSRWHQWFGTFDGRYVRMYFDGVLRATTDTGGTTIRVTAGGPLRLMCGWGGYVTGLYALARLYSRALSLAEIHRNMRNPLNPVRDGLVLFLPFLEGSGTSVGDYSGYGNNGTLYGGVSWRELAKYELPAAIGS